MFAFTTAFPFASKVFAADRKVVPAQHSPTLTIFRADDEPADPPAGASLTFDEALPPKSVNE
ncbi:unannotated protein [freshwater metagenome]|uniref:Unannotated protein n=1 Tax=freshwater metagenome TaxID=449393 RepID=A0A6J6NSB9_9ZZZZ